MRGCPGLTQRQRVLQRRVERLKKEHLQGADIPSTEAILRAKQVVDDETKTVQLQRQNSQTDTEEQEKFGDIDGDLALERNSVDYAGGQYFAW